MMDGWMWLRGEAKHSVAFKKDPDGAQRSGSRGTAVPVSLANRRARISRDRPPPRLPGASQPPIRLGEGWRLIYGAAALSGLVWDTVGETRCGTSFGAKESAWGGGRAEKIILSSFHIKNGRQLTTATRSVPRCGSSKGPRSGNSAAWEPRYGTSPLESLGSWRSWNPQSSYSVPPRTEAPQTRAIAPSGTAEGPNKGSPPCSRQPLGRAPETNAIEAASTPKTSHET